MENKVRTLGALWAKSFHVELDEVTGKNQAVNRRLIVKHPSAVVVVPMIGPDEVLVVTQYRYALGLETLEFPAGKIDPPEQPLEAARRELAEETGYQAADFQKLLSFAPSVGYSNEVIHIFAARNLNILTTPRDEDEISRVEKMKISRLKEMILAGRLIDGTTMLALAVYEWVMLATI